MRRVTPFIVYILVEMQQRGRREFFRQVRHGGGVLGILPVAARAAAALPAGFHVKNFGAKANGTALDTLALQRAIDAASAAGGGTVWFSAGTYLSGTLILKSNVTLHLMAGATLLGSTRLADYPKHIPKMRSFTSTYTETSLLYAEGAERIAIEGNGVIDGQGAAFSGPYKVRPYMIRVIECCDVAISGITLKNSPMWVQHYLGCKDVRIHGITVRSRVNQNNDGIDIDCCERVTISDCNIWSGDDAIVLKSTANRVTRDVAVHNCILSSKCSALKLGTETNGGFENIAIANCTIYDTGISGLTLQMVDGGTLNGVVATNLVMKNVRSPIFMRLGNRARPFVEGGPKPALGAFRNVIISNVQVTGAQKLGCAIAGLPEACIENVTLDNIRIQFVGGGAAADAARAVPEVPEKYPEDSMFGTLPAYGFYCRHVRNARFRNIETSFETDDARPALVCDDVKRLEITNCDFAGAAPRFTRTELIQHD